MEIERGNSHVRGTAHTHATRVTFRMALATHSRVQRDVAKLLAGAAS